MPTRPLGRVGSRRPRNRGPGRKGGKWAWLWAIRWGGHDSWDSFPGPGLRLCPHFWVVIFLHPRDRGVSGGSREHRPTGQQAGRPGTHPRAPTAPGTRPAQRQGPTGLAKPDNGSVLAQRRPEFKKTGALRPRASAAGRGSPELIKSARPGPQRPIVQREDVNVHFKYLL